MLTVPVRFPPVADWRRTRKMPLPPAGIDEGALMMRLKALPPTTSAVGLLMLSVAPPVLVMVNCTDVGVPAGVEAGKMKVEPLATLVVPCCTLIADAGLTVPWSVKVKGL